MSVHVKGRTAALSWDSLTRIPAEKSIRCTGDHIIVEPLDVVHSAFLIVLEETRPVRGIVKVVGPGRHPIRYNHPDKSRRTKMWYSPYFQPTEVKVGDVVELGSPQDGRGYAFQSFIWGDKLHIGCTERDVAAVCQ